LPKIGATCKHMEYMMLVGYRGESVARLGVPTKMVATIGDKMTNTMTARFVNTTTQLDLLTDALKWLSKRTGVPFEDISNHMIVIGDVAHALDKYGSIYGEPLVSDFDFLGYDWDSVLNGISQIWHED